MPSASSPSTKSTATAPALSVVMPVYNALPHLDEAIDSILRQSFEDFEFLILDDASTDGSAERLRHWASRDSRIRLLHADSNLGPVRSSNLVARAAKADLVARMDADDVSYPDRLRKQVEVFGSHPAAAVVASLCDIIDPRGRTLRTPEAWRISRRAAFVPFAHGAMMYRRHIFDRIGGYREECTYWEDQDLVVRMAEAGDVLVIPRSLYKVRAWTSSTRLSSDSKELEQAINRMYAATDRIGGNAARSADEPDRQRGQSRPAGVHFAGLGRVVGGWQAATVSAPAQGRQARSRPSHRGGAGVDRLGVAQPREPADVPAAAADCAERHRGDQDPVGRAGGVEAGVGRRQRDLNSRGARRAASSRSVGRASVRIMSLTLSPYCAARPGQ